MYNDKLILWNEGQLPEDFTVETLLGKHPSRPYNKNVADIFFKAGFIEAWGRGIAKIINGFINAGLPAPVFEATMGGILVTIKRRVSNQTDSKDQINVTENVTENVAENVAENRKTKILEIIKKNNRISTQKIAKELGVSRMTIAREIDYLKQKGILRRIGPDKGGHWEIIER